MHPSREHDAHQRDGERCFPECAGQDSQRLRDAGQKCHVDQRGGSLLS